MAKFITLRTELGADAIINTDHITALYLSARDHSNKYKYILQMSNGISFTLTKEEKEDVEMQIRRICENSEACNRS
jgi:hypothetical protein